MLDFEYGSIQDGVLTITRGVLEDEFSVPDREPRKTSGEAVEALCKLRPETSPVDVRVRALV